jgi:hypothetical protein
MVLAAQNLDQDIIELGTSGVIIDTELRLKCEG